MRTLLLAIGIAGSIFLGVIAGNKGDMSQEHIPVTNKQVTQTPAPTTALTPQDLPGVPKTLQIPALGVNTTIQPVGMDSQGRMDVPDTWTEAGWYSYGYKPGEQGSAVLDGHLDDTSGAPAVFWYIKDLKQGDQILVTDQYNHTFTFVVSDVESYPYNGAPLDQIFNTTDKARLNLITCDGIWNSAQHNYSNRTVVYSVLQGQ